MNGDVHEKLVTSMGGTVESRGHLSAMALDAWETSMARMLRNAKTCQVVVPSSNISCNYKADKMEK